ncbi:Maltose-binding periplasmic proteins/domains [uncultured Ruminococcus sp.]|nr:Maltose-binding periplasmic proteins/domains [uncultured Ruminococcus sp.]
MKKRFLATVLAAALSLSAVLTGCTTGGTASVNDGGGSSGTVSAGNEAWDSSKKDKIVLSVINNYYTAGWKQMAEEYMKLHPETEVVVDVVADNDAYTQKVTTWLTSDDLTQAADIIHINFASGPMGGYNVMYEKDMIYDFNDMMDETNPYNGGKKVSEAFNKDDLPLLQDLGKQYALPFDFVGVAIMYNKDILDKNNIAVPTTNEELVAACTKLKEAGFEAPIAATSEASWYLSSIADAALRAKEQDFLVQAGDGLYDAATMSVNDGFTFNENDWTCDRYTIMSGERIAAYQMENKFLDDTTVAVWDEFRKVAQFFQTNYASSSSTEVLSSFELGNSAFLLSGSWNVGVLNSDIQEMGEDGFEWGTMAFPKYENAPSGFQSELRTLYSVGNAMGIIKTNGDGDHLERVKDFYKFCYSPENSQKMFETTLAAGNFVQGPPAIIGVELSEELNNKLAGFVQEGAVKGDFGGIVGQDKYQTADQGSYIEALNSFLKGDLTAKEFCEKLSPIAVKSVQESIDKNGYDLDPATKDEVKS